MHKIEMLASAIAQQEGFFSPGQTPPKTNKNPGDLRASPLPRKKSPGGFVQFYSDTEGFMALLTQLMLFALRGMTLQQAIETWAPPTGADGGNATQSYLDATVRRTGIDPSTKLSDLFSFQSIP